MAYDEGFATRARRFLSETFGVRGSKNATSWLLAGAAAYYLFYLPEKQRALEIQIEREKAKKRAVELGLEEVDRVRPVHRSDVSTLRGKAALAKQQEDAAAAAAEQPAAADKQQ